MKKFKDYFEKVKKDPCWKGYKMFGTKKKKGKKVPNCIPVNENEYKGKKITLNKPFNTPNGPKKYSVYVKNDKGNIVKVNFGDPNMKIKRDNLERRKNFRARHNCKDKKDKTTPGYWSCKFWSKKSVSDLLK